MWSIKSESHAGKNYLITKKHDYNPKNCNILCRECVCCMLAFDCTCINYSIQNVLCKHIHAVSINSKLHEQYLGRLFAPSVENQSSFSTEVSPLENFYDKDAIVEEIYELYLKAKEAPVIDKNVGEKIHNSVKVLKSLLDTPLNKNTLPTELKEPHNKKLIPQKRFHSTKKVRSFKKRKIIKPSSQESEIIKHTLLNNRIINDYSLHDHDCAKK